MLALGALTNLVSLTRPLTLPQHLTLTLTPTSNPDPHPSPSPNQAAACERHPVEFCRSVERCATSMHILSYRSTNFSHLPTYYLYPYTYPRAPIPT